MLYIIKDFGCINLKCAWDKWHSNRPAFRVNCSLDPVIKTGGILVPLHLLQNYVMELCF